MDLTFNVIFVPGTVRYLRLPILSLLRYSSYRLRLVSNGLPRPELALLKQFAAVSERLELYAYPTTSILPHGTLLTLLATRERSEHFCFMDSDIFACAPFAHELEHALDRCDVFSSCDHLWLDEDQQWKGLTGRCTETPTGLALATTFFCVYRTEPLRRIMAETGVGFERHVFPEHYSDEIADRMRGMGLKVARCDTGKLLNVLAHSYDVRFHYRHLEGLCHIGGISAFFLRSPARRTLRERVRHFLKFPYILRDDDFELGPGKLPIGAQSAETHPDGLDEAALHAHLRARLQRQRIAGYFAFLLRALFDGTPEPVLALTDPSLADRIRRMRSIIRELYGEYRPGLSAA